MSTNSRRGEAGKEKRERESKKREKGKGKKKMELGELEKEEEVEARDVPTSSSPCQCPDTPSASLQARPSNDHNTTPTHLLWLAHHMMGQHESQLPINQYSQSTPWGAPHCSLLTQVSVYTHISKDTVTNDPLPTHRSSYLPT